MCNKIWQTIKACLQNTIYLLSFLKIFNNRALLCFFLHTTHLCKQIGKKRHTFTSRHEASKNRRALLTELTEGLYSNVLSYHTMQSKSLGTVSVLCSISLFLPGEKQKAYSALGHVHWRTLVQALTKSNPDDQQAPDARGEICCLFPKRLSLVYASITRKRPGFQWEPSKQIGFLS